jgi:hypothetical protein
MKRRRRRTEAVTFGGGKDTPFPLTLQPCLKMPPFATRFGIQLGK